MKNLIEQLLNELIGLGAMVDRAFEKHGFNRNGTKFDSPLDRKTEEMALEAQVRGGHTVPPCPVCGVTPHNWAIHEEWLRLPGTKSEDKVAADREAYPIFLC